MKKLLLVVVLCSVSSAFGVQRQTAEQKQRVEALEKRLKNLCEKNMESTYILKTLEPRCNAMRLASRLALFLVLLSVDRKGGFGQNAALFSSAFLGGSVVGLFYDEVSGARKEYDSICLNNKIIEDLIAQKTSLEVPLN